ncbi:ATP-dependent DNA helicase PcrA [Faecalibacterium sp. OF04-11AC]|uniref:ATP-dependent helicase n=1 Tax=Faecalibacterium sp. OF04-11AC TaxID=2293109 RepID=UPI000E822968|nr:UvrD-helicase domain-containing protein [Faecalibacterium sp. OF04-11AC]RGF79042.1 ATP-dependent DNA helicase PcrA [Faecalibacterium sp. OF04-11AC]
MATNLQQEFCKLRDTYIEKQFGRLNEMQRAAVFTTSGPLLILAGAGSGKTTVLVNRIANLIRFGSAHGSSWTPREVTEDDVKALRTALMTGTDAPGWLDGMLRKDAVRSWNVMAITFTNKAAGELKERLRNMLGGEEGDEVFASTFHSACVRILRRWAEEIGYPRSFTIYDTDDSQRVMKTVYKELSVDDKFFPVKSAINQMSRWKDQLVSPAEALQTPAKDTKGALAARVYAAYEKKLKEAGAFDFDDLIYQTVQLLAEHKEARDFYQNKYRYLLVDEYQDTSVAQFRLVSLLTGPEKNICVVGDDDQSIYRFRGATIENILNFERVYPGTKTIRLEQNYRSTSNILNAANCVIQHNTERKGKTLWTQNGEGDKVQVYTAENEQDEASHIADIIGQHLREGGHLADHAVLYRMNAQSAPLESYFTRAGIPHKIVGGQRFNDRKEVKDIHSYMSIVANPRDDVRLRRIINEPARKIGATTIDVIADLAGQEGVSMLEIIRHADQYAKLSRAIAPLYKFYQIYERLQDSLENKTLDEFASDVIEITGYKAMLEADAAKGHEDAADRLQNLGQLVNNVKNYCDQQGEEASLEGYLEDIALISDIDNYNESADQVVLMTIHSAKGLEFPYVFLIGMEEGVFPSEMSKYSEADLEEERRLAYVGITRAKKELYISNSVTRMLYGRTQRNEPSRFLREIEPEYLEETRSPVLEQRSRLGGWGSSYSDTVPGGASGYSGASGWGRGSASYGSYGGSTGYGNHSGYLNREYNAGESRGFGSGYAGRGSSSSGYGSSYGSRSGSVGGSGGFGSGYSRPATPETSAKQINFTGTPAAKTNANTTKHYEPGDVVEHKVFGRGTVVAVKPAAGDQIVEIRFEKVGVKKTMANFAPLTKITEE